MTPEDLDKLEALAANPDAEFVTASVSDFRELIRLARLGQAACRAVLEELREELDAWSPCSEVGGGQWYRSGHDDGVDAAIAAINRRLEPR